MYIYYVICILSVVVHFVINYEDAYFVLLLCSAMSLTAKLECPSGSFVVTAVENLQQSNVVGVL